MRDRRERRPPKPLDPARLNDLALAYVARFATSAAKVEGYLVRKLRERGWEGERPADPRAIVERFVELGYIDDAAWARAKSGGLLRRGYGARRVDQTLGAAGIDADIREDLRPDDAAARQAALALAARRRLGPWGEKADDRAAREKQIAAMVRAGHGFDAARAVVEAPSVSAAEEWAAEAEETP
ncbi:regulatory protein RecX [Tsuneonella amylolytica]|uniref:regulatory protein RecX n=1 Tax=Tsuneonella amylolytica TaxID=2338327 RepID=UPI000EA9FD3A|nr:RecX family transcriptional regulator [Tsuneonella amylolytica]